MGNRNSTHSWILLCLWIGICYTTIYASLLTSPGFTKIIDSIEDFLEAGDKRKDNRKFCNSNR